MDLHLIDGLIVIHWPIHQRTRTLTYSRARPAYNYYTRAQSR